MKQDPAIRLHLLLLAAFLFLQGVARAQDYLNDPNLPAPKHWEGTTEQGGAPAWPDLSYPSREDIDTQLAQIRFMADVSRDFDAARESMHHLWLKVNFWNGFTAKYGIFAGKETLYVQNQGKVLRARIELELQAGNEAVAKHLVRYPYFHAMDPAAQGMALGGFNEDRSRMILDRAFGSAWNDYRAALLATSEHGTARELGQELAAYVAEHFGTTSPELTERVDEWLRGSMFDAIDGLGLRATPALAMMVLRDLAGHELDYPLDPLLVLAANDEQGACRLATDFFEQGNQAFRLRVLNLLESESDLKSVHAWTYPPVTDRIKAPRCQSPHWIDVVTKLASNERTLPRVLDWVQHLAERDALSPALQQNLARAIRAGDAREAISVLTALDSGAAIPSCRSVLEAGMEHESADVRQLAAEQLQHHSISMGLLRAATDKSQTVRLAVATSLTPRSLSLPTYGYSGGIAANMVTKFVNVEPTPEGAQALSSLLQDESSEVRSQAIRALAANEWHFDTAAPYLAAARTNDASLAYSLSRASYPDAATQRTVLLTLANSESSEVLAAMDEVLASRSDWEANPSMWADVLLARLQHPQNGFLFAADENQRSRGWSRSNSLEAIIGRQMNQSTEGVAAALYVARSMKNAALLNEVMNRSENDALRAALQALPSEDLRSTFELALSFSDSSTPVARMINSLPEQGWATPAGAYLAMVGNAQNQQSGRLELAQALSDARISGIEDAVFKLFHNESRDSTFTDVAYALRSQTPEEVATRAKRALQDEQLHPDVAFALAYQGLHGPAGPEIATALLDPSYHSAFALVPQFQRQPSAAALAFDVLSSAPEWTDRHQELLTLAIASDVPMVYQAAIQLAMMRQDPELIPVIGTAVRQANSDDHQMELVRLLTSYMSRDAGRELSQCMGAARNPSITHEINGCLQQIRSYLQEVEFWQGEQEERASEQSAVNELVQMLRDSDPMIRAAAIDGLASFNAKEHLPKIILMLKDENEKVQRAARNAIRVLQGGISTLEPGGDK